MGFSLADISIGTFETREKKQTLLLRDQGVARPKLSSGPVFTRSALPGGALSFCSQVIFMDITLPIRTLKRSTPIPLIIFG
jgi:hypothetical protein